MMNIFLNILSSVLVYDLNAFTPPNFDVSLEPSDKD